MPRLLTYLDPIYAFLAAIDPSLPRALFVALIFGLVLAWRKLWPDSWRAYSALIPVSEEQTSRFAVAVRKVWQGLPSLVLSAIVGALGTGADVWPTLKLALLGVLPPLIHELSWRYQGNLGDGKPLVPPSLSAKVDHVHFTNPRDPDDGPSAAMTGLAGKWRHRDWSFSWPVPRLGVLAVLCFLVALQPACGASAWQAQRDASNVVAQVANDTVEPALLAAYKATGLLVVRAQNTREDAQVALALHQERWKPVWQAWAGFEAAHAAWQNQIDAKGDPLPTAMAARKSFCELRALAKGDWAVELPDFPGPLACPAGVEQ